MAGNTLNPGDKVICRGDYGLGTPEVKVVESIEIVEIGEKYGTLVDSAAWHRMGDGVVVTFDDNTWAYGSQLEQMEQ